MASAERSVFSVTRTRRPGTDFLLDARQLEDKIKYRLLVVGRFETIDSCMQRIVCDFLRYRNEKQRRRNDIDMKAYTAPDKDMFYLYSIVCVHRTEEVLARINDSEEIRRGSEGKAVFLSELVYYGTVRKDVLLKVHKNHGDGLVGDDPAPDYVMFFNVIKEAWDILHAQVVANAAVRALNEQISQSIG
ncbi:hypothetical protein BJ508DRAFT_312113 [Ascobolus immersus RN42]|uniref:Uncharacterized protein n=1 Tax=Ascobolus immersus RN42 TaxID=1160509 RepID=A0A3N4I073_ASCIM|nr:hypothetical protein BJ508DRAFT_312113 [Ascobolus immersus RN42]